MTGFDADTIVTGARVVTMDPRRPEATAFAIRDGRFLAVGDDDLVRELRAGRRRIPGWYALKSYGGTHTQPQ